MSFQNLAGSHFKIWQILNRTLARCNQVWLVRGVLGKATALVLDLSISSNGGESAREAAS
jgi:hypothetical protein